MHVEELNEFNEPVSRVIQTSYKDTYTSELEELYAALAEGKHIKTSVSDAMNDLKLFDMLYRKWIEQEKMAVEVNGHS